MRVFMLLVTILLGCTSTDATFEDDFGSGAGGGKADGTAPEQVRLRYATTTVDCATCEPRWLGVIDIADRGPDKEVVVSWRTQTGGVLGSWHQTPAQFLAVVDESHPDHQLWTFSGIGEDGEGMTQMSIRYRAGGVDDFSETYAGVIADVPGFGKVGVSAPIGARLNVAVTDTRVVRAQTSIAFDTDVLVRNLAYQKDVRIVYSTDGWATVNEAAAGYVYGAADAWGAERWGVHLDLPADASRIDFAIEAKQADSDSWDNNFGRNFTCWIDAADETGACSGLTLATAH